MQTYETNTETGYIYYPIEYVNRAFSNLISYNTLPPENWAIWIKSIDKSKFMDGECNDFYGDQQTIMFDIISVGF